MKRPLIGITAGEIYSKEHPWSPYVFGQGHTYIYAIIHAGGTPIIFPITALQPVIDQLYDSVDGVFFAGGNDLTPSLYHQEPRHTRDNSEARDTFEMALMQKALSAHKPILGICRGLQLLNVARGGSLYQDILREVPGTYNHNSSDVAMSREHLAHLLTIQEGSELAKILQTAQIQSNSHHHQAVNQLGQGLKINAYTDDGIIEGIEDMSQGYILAVQSHPESLFQRVQPEWARLFESFVQAAR